MNSSNKDLWVWRPRPNPAATSTLFCFPYAGGSAQIFASWPDYLPPWVEVCAIQLPGRANRLAEQPYTRLAPLVEALASQLPPYLTTPFAFFGHSMGALLAFELARVFRRRQWPGPYQLYLSGCGAAQRLETDRKQCHTLADAEFIAELRTLNGTPDEVLQRKELMDLVLPVLRSDFSICESYVYPPEPPLPARISAFGGAEDRKVPTALLEAWQEQTTSTFDLQIFPGDHFFLNTAQPALMRTIAAHLCH